MQLFLKLTKGTVLALIAALDLCMLLRAVLSWFVEEDNAILGFVTMMTEPIVAPFRALFDRFGWFQNSPLVVPFFAGFLALQLVGTLLGAF